MDEFHFLRPVILLLLIPAAFGLYYLWRQSADGSRWRDLIDSELLQHLLDADHRATSRWPVLVLGLGLVLAVFAAAGPAWERLPGNVKQKNDALILLLDLSLSMRATDVKPSRVTRARHKLRDILNQRDEGLTALIVFAGDAHAVAPLTEDADTIESMVSALSPEIMPRLGSRPDQAVELALRIMQDGGATRANLILIGDEITERDRNRILPLLSPDITLSVLAVGTPEGGPIGMPGGGFFKDDGGNIVIPRLDGDAMRALARAGGGEFARLGTSSRDIEQLLAVTPLADSELSDTEREFDQWLDRGIWLVWLCLPLALLAFRRGWLLAIGCVAVVSSPPASAMDWKDLWQRKDQQGQELLDNNRPAEAVDKFDDPAWKGTAHYRAGEFAQAVESFSQSNDVQGLYNLGNALARAGQLQQASDSYQKVLDIDPQHDDALHNKQLVDELLQQQQEQQNENQQNESQNDQQQQGDQQNDSSDSEEGQESQEQESEQQDADPQDGQQQPSDQQDGEATDQQPQENQSAEDQQQESENEQEGEQQNGETEDSEPGEGEAQELEAADEPLDEQQQALEQWLRRIPDDPGGLLRNKFRYQSEVNRRNREYVDEESKVW